MAVPVCSEFSGNQWFFSALVGTLEIGIVLKRMLVMHVSLDFLAEG